MALLARTKERRGRVKAALAVKTLPELVADTQQDDRPQLLNWPAAIDQPAALLRRYRRHCAADNAQGWAIWQKPALFGLAAGAAGYLVTMFLVGILYPGYFGHLLGAIVGPLAGWIMAVKVMWEAIHSMVTITDGADPRRPWRATYIMDLWAPTLGFRLRPEVHFGDGDRPAIRLFVPKGLEHLDYIQPIYGYRAAHRHTELSVLEDTYERLTGEAGNGLTLKATEKKDKYSLLKESWGKITLGICIAIAAYCIVQMNDGVLIGRPDVEIYQQQLQQVQPASAAPPEAAAETAPSKPAPRK